MNKTSKFALKQVSKTRRKEKRNIPSKTPSYFLDASGLIDLWL